jgi:hypothetical protein
MSVPPVSYGNKLVGGTSSNCLYGLDIKGVDPQSGEVRATVAEAEVDRNRNRMNDYFSRQLFSTSWFTDFSKEDFPFHVYAFKVEDKNDLNRFKEGDKDVNFESVPNTHLLRFCDATCLSKRAESCRQHYGSKPEDNKCGEKMTTPKD